MITSYRAAVHAAPIQSPIKTPQAGTTYTIAQLFALINANNPMLSSNFIYTPDGINSYSAGRLGFTTEWAQNNPTSVTLVKDPNQVQNLIKRGVLPNASVMSTLAKAISNASKQNAQLATQLTQLKTFLQSLSNNFPKIMLYFNAVSPVNGQTYKLYITDPCPGATNWGLILPGTTNSGLITPPRLSPPQNYVPAHTNVLSHWNVK